MAPLESEFHVPGAYTFDNPPAFPAVRSASPPHSLGANLFRPPVSSPSPSGSAVLNMAKSTSSLFSDISMSAAAGTTTPTANAKRKRATNDSRESTPLPPDWGSMSVETDGGDGNIVYTLAGQIDTPSTCGLPLDGLDDSVYTSYSDVDYRRALGPQRGQGQSTSWGTAKLSPPESSDEERWTVLHALGSVVGKVWEFCTTGTFRGFHAGDGAGYDWETGKPTADDAGSAEPNTEQGPERLKADDSKRNAGDWTAGTPTTTLTQHVGKRRQIGTAGDELGRSWVMVQPDSRGGLRATAASPRSISHRSSPARATTILPGTGRRSGGPSRRINTPVARLGTSGAPPTYQNSRLRVSHAGSPGLVSREPASFASPRAPVAARSPVPPAAATPPRRGSRATLAGQTPLALGSPAAAGSRIPKPQPSPSAGNPFARVAGSPRAGSSRSRTHQRSQSSISSMGGGGARGVARTERQTPAGAGAPVVAEKDYDAAADSPRLTDEAKRLAAQKRAADQDADEKMEAFNRRLQEMIRQGQEALGTRFEVDMGDDDDDGDEDAAGDDDNRRDACFWVDE